MDYKIEGVSLKSMSSAKLRQLAKACKSLAEDLERKQPSYRLALAAGVENHGYNTVRFGGVNSFRGEAIVTMEGGARWRCVGHGPKGTAEYVYKQGWIEFIPLDND